mmetsp:Transcript_106310/g.295786  ORF Transcript_106310/g.295786 Transcript_106310/m.295786 type:complete len:414 (+) Transcript_106310:1256-2497(+)
MRIVERGDGADDAVYDKDHGEEGPNRHPAVGHLPEHERRLHRNEDADETAAQALQEVLVRFGLYLLRQLLLPQVMDFRSYQFVYLWSLAEAGNELVILQHVLQLVQQHLLCQPGLIHKTSRAPPIVDSGANHHGDARNDPPGAGVAAEDEGGERAECAQAGHHVGDGGVSGGQVLGLLHHRSLHSAPIQLAARPLAQVQVSLHKVCSQEGNGQPIDIELDLDILPGMQRHHRKNIQKDKDESFTKAAAAEFEPVRRLLVLDVEDNVDHVHDHPRSQQQIDILQLVHDNHKRRAPADARLLEVELEVLPEEHGATDARRFLLTRLHPLHEVHVLVRGEEVVVQDLDSRCVKTVAQGAIFGSDQVDLEFVGRVPHTVVADGNLERLFFLAIFEDQLARNMLVLVPGLGRPIRRVV